MTPRHSIFIDFETFRGAEVSLSAMSNEEYVRDPRAEVLGLGVRTETEPFTWLEEWQIADWCKTIDWANTRVASHNLAFDGALLAWRYGVKPARWTCTLSLARIVLGYETEHGIADLAHLVGLPPKLGMPDVMGKRRHEISQATWEALGEYCRRDVEIGSALDEKFLFEAPEFEHRLVDWTMRAFIEPALAVDLASVGPLIKADAEDTQRKLEQTAQILGWTKPLPDLLSVLKSKPKFADLLRSLGAVIEKKPGKRGPQDALAKADLSFQLLVKSANPKIKAACQMRLRATSNIVRTRGEALFAAGQRGLLPVSLNYCGAHTQRWSGGGGVNLQNLVKGPGLRSAVVAPPGKKMAAADSSQIEPRVTAWVAGETLLLDAFKRSLTTGEDFYCSMWLTLTGQKITKAENPRVRDLAKAVAIGLGYGMGSDKFALQLLQGANGIKPIIFTQADMDKFRLAPAANGDPALVLAGLSPEGAAIQSAVSEYLVKAYRRTFPRIPQLWRKANDTLFLMTLPDADQAMCPLRGCTVAQGRIIKPTGTSLLYPGIRRLGSEYMYQGRHGSWTKIYGAKLVENLVQSMARDVVAWQLLEIEDVGYKGRLMSHDENVFCEPDDQAEECLRVAIAKMRIPPPWCPDLPVAAEGHFAQSYAECK